MPVAKRKTPLGAIRAFCLDCVSTAHEVSLCVCANCSLYPFRFGKNPARAGQGGGGNAEALRRYRETRDRRSQKSGKELALSARAK